MHSSEYAHSVFYGLSKTLFLWLKKLRPRKTDSVFEISVQKRRLKLNEKKSENKESMPNNFVATANLKLIQETEANITQKITREIRISI